MDEKYFNSQSQDSEPVEVSIWAKRAIWCVVLGFLMPLLTMWLLPIILRPLMPEHMLDGDPRMLLYILPVIITCLGGGISILAGLIFSIMALRDIWIEEGQLRGKWRAVATIVLSLTTICFLLISKINLDRNEKRVYPNIENCEAHITELGKALKKYAAEHGSYPEPDKWCDMLLQGKYVTEDIFKCPGNKKARCSYSINPKCRPNSPPGEILIFESDGGWNSFGGPALFSVKHHAHYGGCILSHDLIYVLWDEYDPNGWPAVYMEELRELKKQSRDLK